MSNAATTQISDREGIRTVIKEGLMKIGRFVNRPEFQGMLQELYARDQSARPEFVLEVVLNDEERRKRGINVPDDLIIQRSAFGDARPTLFCVTQQVPLAHPWHKVTITFDS